MGKCVNGDVVNRKMFVMFFFGVLGGSSEKCYVVFWNVIIEYCFGCVFGLVG